MRCNVKFGRQKGAQPLSAESGLKRNIESSGERVKEKNSPRCQKDIASLLSDAPCRSTSPPAKRRQPNKGTRKGQVEIPQPPPLKLNQGNKKQSKKMDQEMSFELLDML
jgi:hypothetical protein